MPLIDSICRGALRMGKSGWGSRNVSKSKVKRASLTHRYSKKGYYKGTGARIIGRLGSKANFIVEPDKKLELVVPDMAGFPLKPYVARTV